MAKRIIDLDTSTLDLTRYIEVDKSGDAESSKIQLQTLKDDFLTNVLALDNVNVYTPTSNYHPATKKYVDDNLSGFTTDHGGLGGLSDDDHTQYHNNTRGDVRYLKRDGSNNMQGILDMNDYRITTVQNPTSNYDAVNKIWAEQQFSKKTNVLLLNNTTEFIPDSDYEPSTKKYVDDEINKIQSLNLFAGYFATETDLNNNTYTYDDVNVFVNGVPAVKGTHSNSTLYAPGNIVFYSGQYYVLGGTNVEYGVFNSTRWINIISGEYLYYGGSIYLFTSGTIEEKPYIKNGSYAIVEQTDTVWVYDSDTQLWADSGNNSQVTSVNTLTGDVVLDADDISSTATRLWLQSYQNQILIALGNEWTFGVSLIEIDNSIQAINVNATGNLDVIGTSNLQGNVTLDNNLTVNGNIIDQNSDTYPTVDSLFTSSTLRDEKTRVNLTATATLDLDSYDVFKHTPTASQQYTIQNHQIGDCFQVRLLPGSGSLNSTLFLIAGKTIVVSDPSLTLTAYDNTKSFILSCFIANDESNVVYIDTVLTELETS